MKLLPILLLILGLSASVAPPPAYAESEHDRARAAVRAGQILPLTAILNQIRAQVPGRVLGVELLGDGRRTPYVYNVKMLTARGDVVQLQVDARTASVLQMQGHRGGGKARRGGRRGR